MATHKFVGDVEVTGNIKSPTTDASLYNLGAYDSVVDNGDGTVTITRQTGYANSFSDFVTKNGFSWFGDGKPDWATARRSISTTRFAGGKSAIIANCPVLDGGSAWAYSGTSQIVISYEASKLSFYFQSGGDTNTPLEIQYKLTASYTETVIKDRPLSQLSADGEEYIKGLYDKSLQLCESGTGVRSGTSGTFYIFLIRKCHLKPATTYTIDYGRSLSSGAYVTYGVNDWDENVLIQNYSSARSRTFTTSSSFVEGVYTLMVRGTFDASVETSDLQVMLVEGGAALPWQPYDVSGHIGNAEAQFLLDEYQKTTNIFDSSRVYNYATYPVIAFVVGKGSVSITDRGQYPYDRVCFDIPNAKDKTFTFSATVPYDTMVHIYQKDGSNTTLINQPRYVSGTALTFTPTVDVACICFYAYNPDDPWGTSSSSHKVITFSNIMINEGSQALLYQPYDASGHISAPEAKLLLDEYQKSANLFHIDTNAIPLLTINNGTSVYFNFSGERSVYVAIKPNTTYTFSADKAVRISQCASVPANGLSTTSGKGVDVTANTSVTFTTAADSQYFVVSTSVLTWNEVKVTLVEGTYVMPYQEYHGQIVHEGDAGVLLWQNASPNDAFAAQTINVADMSKYKYIVFAFKTYKTATWSLMYQKIKYDLSATGGTTLFLNDWNSDVSMIYPKCRFVKLASATSVTFSTGYEKSTNQSADQVVPVAIYGTNIL